MTDSRIRFTARLLRPAGPGKPASWSFIVLPKTSSVKLPSRGMMAIEGTFNGVPFQATLEPDGDQGHWLKVNRKMREAAGVDLGDLVAVEIRPARKEPDAKVPADLRRALAAAPQARALW